MDSILTSIKKTLGIGSEYTHFDPELILHINAALMILNQLGVGPSTGFTIEDDTATWMQFTDRKDLSAIQSYVYLRVRLLFDPPTNSFLVEAIKNQISEFEWRINDQQETPAFVEGG